MLSYKTYKIIYARKMMYNTLERIKNSHNLLNSLYNSRWTLSLFKKVKRELLDSFIDFNKQICSCYSSI